jgi:hypothetical protein
MPDIYVDIGPMTYNSDAKKADKKYAEKAKNAIKAAAAAALGGAPGFTTKKGPGFTLRLKVDEVTVGPKGVTCKVKGELLRYPKPLMVSTSLNGSATVPGHGSDTDVTKCLEAIVKDMLTKNVIPVMKQLGP